MTSSNVVVVGVDGSVESATALRYAIGEANRRCARLRVVAAYAYPEYLSLGYETPILVSPATLEAQLRDRVQAMVDAELADDQMPPVTEVVVRAGAAVEVLVEGSDDAEVLVVGHRGRGGFASALLGSVGLGCVLHARCPVVVVRPARVPERETVPRAPERVLATALDPTD